MTEKPAGAKWIEPTDGDANAYDDAPVSMDDAINDIEVKRLREIVSLKRELAKIDRLISRRQRAA